MDDNVDAIVAIEDASTEDVVVGMIPYSTSDNNKAAYLAYRASGFGTRESTQLVGVSEASVRRWRRTDPEFKRLDGEGLQELRRYVGLEVTAVRFTRNLTLILERDYKVLTKAVTEPYELTKDEKAYLNRMRSFYTPQQMESLRKLIAASGDDDFDYDEFMMSIRDQRDVEVRVKRRR